MNAARRSGWNHNTHYYPTVLAAAPHPCVRALDIGCGEGRLCLLLAPHCREVIGLDLHPELFPSPPGSPNLSFAAGDVMSVPFAPGSFDLISAVAVLHHLPLRAGLERMRDLLMPGGVLVIVGLYRATTVADRIQNMFALLASRMLRLTRGYAQGTASFRPPRESLGEIRRAAEAVLPGALVRRKLLFRYVLTWKKPQPEGTTS